METSIIIAGFEGQGVLFAGHILAYAGIDSGKYVTWTSSYIPKKQRGTAHCTIVMGDKPVEMQTVTEPNVAIVLDEPSYEKYQSLVQPGGTLVVNSSLVNSRSPRGDVDVVYVPASTLAQAYGSIQLLNMAAVGALLARQLFLPITAVENALQYHLPCAKSELLMANLQVLHGGFRAATILIDAPRENVEENMVS